MPGNPHTSTTHSAGAGHDTDGDFVPPAPTDPRLDRLADEMHQIRQGLLEMRDAILDRIDGAYVRKDTHELEMRGTSDRIEVLSREINELKTGRNWTVALVIGAVITAVLSAVLHT
jgi:hypothetical protein